MTKEIFRALSPTINELIVTDMENGFIDVSVFGENNDRVCTLTKEQLYALKDALPCDPNPQPVLVPEAPQEAAQTPKQVERATQVDEEYDA